MNPVINKFLVALVTVLGAAGVLISDGVTTEEVIALAILGLNAAGVYGVPNATTQARPDQAGAAAPTAYRYGERDR